MHFTRKGRIWKVMSVEGVPTNPKKPTAATTERRTRETPKRLRKTFFSTRTRRQPDPDVTFPV